MDTRTNHLQLAQNARDALNEDKVSASDDTYVGTFDLQKALPFPKLTTSVAYYKRNMYVYNCGIHSFNNSTGYMYVWDETNGGRGSHDISTCVVKHLKTHANDKKQVIFYSDTCTG